MRCLLSFILLFVHLSIFGQGSKGQYGPWDILFARNENEIKRYEDVLQKQLHHIDTVQTKNSIVITYFSANKKQLQKVENILDSNKCIVGILREYYNAAGLLEYRTAGNKCCPQANQDEECFERVSEYERLGYDDLGRVVVRVWHVSTPGTYKETYTYAQDGTRQTKREKISETSFWE